MAKRVRLSFRDKDDWILEELERIVIAKKAMGIDTTLSTEIARLLRQSIVGDHDQFLERAKDLGLFEVWKHKLGDSDEH